MMRPYPVDTTAENKRALRRTLRRYALLAGAIAVGVAWALGYGQGMLTGYREGFAAHAHKESNS